MTKRNSKAISVFLVILISITIFTQIEATEIKESAIVPKAKKERYEKSMHEDILVDYYHWLKDKNWPKVDTPEIINYLNEENQYTENYFLPYKGSCGRTPKNVDLDFKVVETLRLTRFLLLNIYITLS
jgi:hypothetical protein